MERLKSIEAFLQDKKYNNCLISNSNCKPLFCECPTEQPRQQVQAICTVKVCIYNQIKNLRKQLEKIINNALC